MQIANMTLDNFLAYNADIVVCAYNLRILLFDNMFLDTDTTDNTCFDVGTAVAFESTSSVVVARQVMGFVAEHGYSTDMRCS